MAQWESSLRDMRITWCSVGLPTSVFVGGLKVQHLVNGQRTCGAAGTDVQPGEHIGPRLLQPAHHRDEIPGRSGPPVAI
jgi:hypothetical protein